MLETWVRFLGQEYPLEKEMATHSSILAWRIPWTEYPGRLGSQESDTMMGVMNKKKEEMDRRCQAGQDRDGCLLLLLFFSLIFLAALCQLVGRFIILAVSCYSIIIKLPLIYYYIFIHNIINIVNWASLVAQLVKKSACNAGDPSLIPEFGCAVHRLVGLFIFEIIINFNNILLLNNY